MTLTIALISSAAVVVAAVISFAGVWMKSFLDQQARERESIRADVEKLKKQVANLGVQGRYKDDYINMLRSHIEEEKPPPPPSYPPALLRIAMEGF